MLRGAVQVVWVWKWKGKRKGEGKDDLGVLEQGVVSSEGWW
jgi:hypothetical protein